MDTATSGNVAYAVGTYAIYMSLSVVMTIWVAQTLFKHGRTFLVDAFTGNEALASSINHLLVVGFYLVNLGIVCLNLALDHAVNNPAQVFESIATKLGIVLLVLGGMHMINLVSLHRVREGRLNPRPAARPQYPPAQWMAPPPPAQ
jgi:hypothetical protein